jgi:hypothetical protein
MILNPPSISVLQPASTDPLLVKLTTGEELVARVYHDPDGEMMDSDLLMLHRPMQMMVQYSQSGIISTYFKKWLLFAAGETIPVWMHDVLTVTPIKDDVLKDYDERVHRLYELADPRTDEERDEAIEKAKETAYGTLLKNLPVDDSKVN